MCVCFFAYQAHPAYEFILAHNRDEFYSRKTAPAAFWLESPLLLAGRDLRSGGTWLGVTTEGKFSWVTNFRNPAERRENMPSRGELVKRYLAGKVAPLDYMNEVAKHAANYNGFNLIAGDKHALVYLSSVEHRARALDPGVYGLSNGLLDEPWPKVERGKKAFQDLIRRPGDPTEALMKLMSDTTPAPDDKLPSTGVGLTIERQLSPIFIRTPHYGTRATTLVLWRQGEGKLLERSYDRDASTWTEKRFSIPA